MDRSLNGLWQGLGLILLGAGAHRFLNLEASFYRQILVNKRFDLHLLTVDLLPQISILSHGFLQSCEQLISFESSELSLFVL